MDKLESQYNMLARRVLIAAESGESEKFKGLFKGRQPEEIKEALTDTSQERYNDVLGNVHFTPLIAGAWHGHIYVVDELLENYRDIVDINQVGYVNLDGTKREVTALCAAIRQQNLEMAQHMIDLGAKIDFCCPLAIACHSADVKSARLLIKNKADINARYDAGTTCLMTACERYSLYTVRHLLNSGADPRLEDANGNTAIHRLALKNRNFVLKNGPLPQIIDALVNAGAYATTKNQAGKTPLDVACATGNVEMARIIMCLPEVRPEEHMTAQSKLRERLERTVSERRSNYDAVFDGPPKTVRKSAKYSESFTNPIEQRKQMRKSKSVAEKISDMADKIADLAESLDKETLDLTNGTEQSD